MILEKWVTKSWLFIDVNAVYNITIFTLQQLSQHTYMSKKLLNEAIENTNLYSVFFRDEI